MTTVSVPELEIGNPTATLPERSNLDLVKQTSILNHPVNSRIENNTFHITNKAISVYPGGDKRLKGLYRRAARNAISNTEGRADDPKCHPGTRVQVIGLIDHWMDDANRLSRILWLSGPAGAGKTAIMKTIADRCKDRGVHTANFFFFHGDPTRNFALPLVATLVYQILQLYPITAPDAVGRVLVSNPLILEASIDEQFTELIYPLFDIISRPSANTRIVLIVDGLDECKADANRDQTRIIQALSNLATQQHSSFLVLVASRPEPHIQMAFNQATTKIESIFLNDGDSSRADIRLFVKAEFDRIKSSHPRADSLPHNWPSTLDVKDIVTKSSSQFIYAATVMRYIAQAAIDPSLSLLRVTGIMLPANNSPFSHLDSVYSYILSRADDLEATRAVLSMKLLEVDVHVENVSVVELLHDYDSNYTKAVVESCIAELSAIVHLTPNGNIKFYHASMTDYLLDQSRSQEHWIDINAFRHKCVEELWQRTMQHYRFVQLVLLADCDKPTARITHMLLNLPFPEWTQHHFFNMKWEMQPLCTFLHAIYKLYYADDMKTYKRIVSRFIRSSLSSGFRPDVTDIPYAQEYLEYYERYAGFFKLLSITPSVRILLFGMLPVLIFIIYM